MSLNGNAENCIELRGSISLPETIHGKSAYEIAVYHGFDGTEEEWLESLRAKSTDEALDIVQTTGDSEKQVMSQKAVTECLGGKLDKVTDSVDYERVYAIGADGAQKTIRVGDSSYYAGLARYSGDRTLRSMTPVYDNDCANKKYVDDSASGKLDKVTKSDGLAHAYIISTTGKQETRSITGYPVAYNLPAYSGNQTLQTNTPIENNDCANKMYVDRLVASLQDTITALTARITKLEATGFTLSFPTNQGDFVNAGITIYYADGRTENAVYDGLQANQAVKTNVLRFKITEGEMRPDTVIRLQTAGATITRVSEVDSGEYFGQSEFYTPQMFELTADTTITGIRAL